MPNEDMTLEQKYQVLLDATIATMEFALRSEEIEWKTFFNIARDALREVDPVLAERVEDAPYHPEWVAIEERRLKELEEHNERMAKQREQQRQLEERNKRRFGTE